MKMKVIYYSKVYIQKHKKSPVYRALFTFSYNKKSQSWYNWVARLQLYI